MEATLRDLEETLLGDLASVDRQLAEQIAFLKDEAPSGPHRDRCLETLEWVTEAISAPPPPVEKGKREEILLYIEMVEEALRAGIDEFEGRRHGSLTSGCRNAVEGALVDLEGSREETLEVLDAG